MGSTLEGSKGKIIFKRNSRGKGETRLILIYFLRYLSAKGLPHGTISAYRGGLIKYIDFLKESKIPSFDQVNKSSFENYSVYLKKEGHKIGSIVHRLEITKIFYRFMLSEGYINKDIYNLIKPHQKENEFINKIYKRSTLECLKEFLEHRGWHKIKIKPKIPKKMKLVIGTPTKLFCEDCVDMKGCKSKRLKERLKECKYKIDLLKVV